MSLERIEEAFAQSIEAKQALTGDDHALILEIANTMIEALNNGKKVIWMGNGGSAADAQHLAAELVSKFYLERAGLPSLALNANTSILTAVGNDYGFDHVFERQIEAVAESGDVVVGISTSGNSPNVLRAIDHARSKGCVTVAMTGRSGGQLVHSVDLCFRAPSDDTPRIQEVHITAGHIICEVVEATIFG
jgi:D-sedoheptulose 7-phosphate isomerase